MAAQIMSKDPSSKVQASLMNPHDFTPLTDGFNGIPRQVKETPERQARPLKYAFTEHAERNGLYNLARSLGLQGSIALTTKVPHTSCFRALVSVGVQSVVMPQMTEEEKAHPDFKVWTALLEETGTAIYFMDEQRKIIPGPDLTAHQIKKLNQYIEKVFTIPTLSMVKDPYADATLFIDPEDYRVLTEGYSGFPRGADDSKVERYEMPAREHWVEGSIRNAVYNFLRPMLKDSLGIVTHTTCVECARALVSVGCKHVAYMEPTEDFKQRWGESIESALATLKELNVEVIPVERSEVFQHMQHAVAQLSKDVEQLPKEAPNLQSIGL